MNTHAKQPPVILTITEYSTQLDHLWIHPYGFCQGLTGRGTWNVMPLPLFRELSLAYACQYEHQWRRHSR